MADVFVTNQERQWGFAPNRFLCILPLEHLPACASLGVVSSELHVGGHSLPHHHELLVLQHLDQLVVRYAHDDLIISAIPEDVSYAMIVHHVNGQLQGIIQKLSLLFAVRLQTLIKVVFREEGQVFGARILRRHEVSTALTSRDVV